VTALIDEVGNPQPIKGNRLRRHVKLIDQSGKESKVQETTWTFFSDATPNSKDRATIDILHEYAGTDDPITFFALAGKKIDQGYSIENTKEFFLVKAIGDRADELKKNAKTLRDTPADDRQVLEHAVGSGRDYKSEQGTQSWCKILSNMTKKTNIKSIDNNTTLWQLNWVEIAWPEGDEDELCTRDGKKLFFPTNARDGTGLSPKMRMNEESALALAKAESKETFLEQHKEGRHTFPAMATVKVLREVKTSKSGGQHSAQSDQEENEYINFTIVHAVDQPLDEKPSQATLELVPLMPQMEFDSACIVPGALHMVKASSHYAFQLQMQRADDKDPLLIPCQKIVGLVKSTKNSTTEPLGTVGFKVVTKEVECMLGARLEPNASAQNSKFVLSSTCPVGNVTSYKLDPPRGSAQYALVTITGKIGEVFVVEKVQQLPEKEAKDAQESLCQLFLLAANLSLQDLKRNAPWTEDHSPAQAKRCRVLGRAPTDAALNVSTLL
jgi:hypothetical protein